MSDSQSLETQPFDYTARDWATIRRDMFRRLKLRVPDWVENDSSFEVIILDLVSSSLDVLHFYIDRMAAEAYIQSAVLRESVLNLCAMYGYTPAPQTAAIGSVTFTKTAAATNVLVPAGTRVYASIGASAQVVFETIEDITITSTPVTTTVVEGTTVNMESLGISSGAERQVFPLFNRNVIADSVRFFVQDGPIDAATGLPTNIEWHYLQRLIDADSPDRVFTTSVDENGVTFIHLGDGITGSIPATSAPLFATYRYGVGASGNVGAGDIKALVAGGALAAQIAAVTNTAALTGGANAESLASMRTNAPKSLRALDRAVTLEDYGALALQVGGVARASAMATVPTSVTVYLLATGGNNATTQLKDVVKAYLNKRRMALTTITIADATKVNINVTVSITVNDAYRRREVQNAVKAAITKLYSFDNVQLGQRMKAAAVFAAIEDIAGVDVVDITVHDRGVGAGYFTNIQLLHNEIAQAGVITVNATGGIAPL
jgi:Baseplate J-like protein